jgi:hypothetical protein
LAPPLSQERNILRSFLVPAESPPRDSAAATARQRWNPLQEILAEPGQQKSQLPTAHFPGNEPLEVPARFLPFLLKPLLLGFQLIEHFRGDHFLDILDINLSGGAGSITQEILVLADDRL